jgi:hypothetical protein
MGQSIKSVVLTFSKHLLCLAASVEF